MKIQNLTFEVGCVNYSLTSKIITFSNNCTLIIMMAYDFH